MRRQLRRGSASSASVAGRLRQRATHGLRDLLGVDLIRAGIRTFDEDAYLRLGAAEADQHPAVLAELLLHVADRLRHVSELLEGSAAQLRPVVQDLRHWPADPGVLRSSPPHTYLHH